MASSKSERFNLGGVLPNQKNLSSLTVSPESSSDLMCISSKDSGEAHMFS